ncbi:MAG TPA: acyl-CoA thioesterase domain-containing protein [Acidimicrobiales bacterium]|jgi:acyl-CoA thioesterase|nr:acyl-CoA thioesterase domain-containing protein [Acidimicrobiales bacterium]
MHVERYPYRASASCDGQVVAASDSCLCVEAPGADPVLYFPVPDIDEKTVAASPDWLVLSDGAPALTGFAAFDQDRVRIEVTDEAEGDEARDVTVKRFPTWGDTAHLVDVMDVRPTDEPHSFVTVARSDESRPVVEGSQMLGQAIVAAGRHAPDRRVVSATMMFLRSADAHLPLQLELTELSAGRTFSGLAVQVLQRARVCAAGTLLLDVPSDDVVRHAPDAPDVPGPYACEPYDMGVTGRDIRVVDAAYSNDSEEPPGPPIVDAWVRFRQLPADQPIHAGLLAQFTGHMSIAAALRPHAGVGQDQAHRTISMAINSISLSLHAPVQADEWLLYRHLSTFAGAGTTHAENRVYDLDGALIASFSVDAMVRPLPAGAKGPMDGRTAL